MNKTKFILLALTLALALALGSCNKNDGDIGPLFGIWRVEKVTRDGVDVDLHADGAEMITLTFQNAILEINTTDAHHYLTTCLANWSREGQDLNLEFDNSDATGNTARYTPPAILGWKYGEVCQTQIVSLTSSRMELHYTDGQGADYRYWLKKTK